MTKTKDLETETPSLNGVAHGYAPMPSTRRVIANDFTRFPTMQPADGCEPFWADIRDDLTIGEQKRIPIDGPWQPILELIAPWIVAWNAGPLNPVSEDARFYPPPAEAGWEILEEVSKNTLSFLVFCFKYNIGGDLPKEPSGIDDSVAG